MLGARLDNNGCHFRVWAPNAREVHVVGDFNWNADASNRLASEAGGYWKRFIAGAKEKQRYKFRTTRQDGTTVDRIDPAARYTLHSGLGDPKNGGFIVKLRDGWPDFTTPAFDNFIIYQLHVGSFAGFNDDFAGSVDDETATTGMIESKLGYIRELGFNAIELLPMNNIGPTAPGATIRASTCPWSRLTAHRRRFDGSWRGRTRRGSR